MKTIFELHPKLFIGVVHLKPLPGSPRFHGTLENVINNAVVDASAYDRGGAHALFIENFGDAPFAKGTVGPETIACMAVVAKAIREHTKLPFGFNVLRNDARAALALCAALVQALKMMGHDPAKNFNERLIAHMAAQQSVPTTSHKVVSEPPFPDDDDPELDGERP